MIILGLTGSIGMGKSTASIMFRRLGVPVHDADKAVHDLFAVGGAAVPLIAERFPSAVVDAAVNRPLLSKEVVGNAEAFADLERIVHPLVARERDRFLKRHRARGSTIVVLDVPLLFETGGEKNCDFTVVVSAPAFLQRQRVLRRGDMSVEKFKAILAKQMPDWQKRRKADFVVPTGLGIAFSFARIRTILKTLRRKKR